MTKKILIPIDFTDHSTKALEYAAALNKLSPHELDLVHIFNKNDQSDAESISNPGADSLAEDSIKDHMKHIVSELSLTYPDIKTNTIYTEGNLYNEIKKLTASDSYDAVVMGTKGASGLDAILSESNMYEIFENTNTPVLAVPLFDKKVQIDTVGLLCNFKAGEIEVLKQAIAILGTNFQLVLIHINTEDNDIALIDQKFKDFIDLVIKEIGIEDISYTVKNQTFFIQYKENISQAIDSVILDEQIDLLLITKSRKGLLRKVVEENVVKKMAFQISIPKFFAKRPN